MGMPSDFEPGGDEIGSPPEVIKGRHAYGESWLNCPHPICVENRAIFIVKYGEEALTDVTRNRMERGER